MPKQIELTLEQFEKLPSGVFAKGESIDSPEGIYMTGSGKLLKWVAVKGWVEDWCVYAHLSEKSFQFVQTNGDKVCGEEHIRRVVPCTREVFNRYRY